MGQSVDVHGAENHSVITFVQIMRPSPSQRLTDWLVKQSVIVAVKYSKSGALNIY